MFINKKLLLFLFLVLIYSCSSEQKKSKRKLNKYSNQKIRDNEGDKTGDILLGNWKIDSVGVNGLIQARFENSDTIFGFSFEKNNELISVEKRKKMIIEKKLGYYFLSSDTLEFLTMQNNVFEIYRISILNTNHIKLKSIRDESNRLSELYISKIL
jgi:hypothetical protein